MYIYIYIYIYIFSFFCRDVVYFCDIDRHCGRKRGATGDYYPCMKREHFTGRAFVKRSLKLTRLRANGRESWRGLSLLCPRVSGCGYLFIPVVMFSVPQKFNFRGIYLFNKLFTSPAWKKKFYLTFTFHRSPKFFRVIFVTLKITTELLTALQFNFNSNKKFTD